jgi:hypothetical protein
MEGQGILHNLWLQFQQKYESNFSGEWNYHNPLFGHVTWFFEEGAFLEIVNDYDTVFVSLLPFLRRYGLPEDLFAELVRYQRCMLRKPYDNTHVEAFSFDFHTYFENILTGEYVPLQKKENLVRISPKTVYTNFFEYAKETVWYGRRRGASVYGKMEISICAGNTQTEAE